MQVNTIPTFETKEDATQWMFDTVDDPCVDNYRFAFIGDVEAEQKYDDQKENGCCGFFDAEVLVDGKKSLIGCNYGH